MVDKPFEPIGSKALFLVWAAPDQGSPRSRLMARELGIGAPVYLGGAARRGTWTAPFRYLIYGVRTLRLLFEKNPRVILVQSPPGFAVWFTALYCALTGGCYIIDAHSDALQRSIWMKPLWLTRRLARNALATLVTNDHHRQLVESWGGKAIVLRDPVTSYPFKVVPLNGHFSVTVVNTFAGDEPLQEVLHAAEALPDVTFYVTGKKRHAPIELLEMAPANVQFTDFLPDEDYYGLLNASSAVISLTTRDHTLQCGACEALSLARPIITSDWPLLREYFSQGTVHVDNSSQGIREGVEQVRREYDRMSQEVLHLRALRRRVWEQQIKDLAFMIADC